MAPPISFPVPTILSKSFAAIGLVVATTFFLKCLDIVYLHVLRPSRLQRYQHYNKDADDHVEYQETRAWALITGSSDGIGFALASELARQGFNVAFHGRNPVKLDERIAQLESTFPQTAFRSVVADAGDSHGMRKRIADMAADMANLPGPLTVLINNVHGGISLKDGKPEMIPLANQSAANTDTTININIRFPTQLTRELLPLLQRNAPGLVIVMGSMGADISGIPYTSAYMAGKGYLKMWTQAIGAEMAVEGHDIEVLGISVGGVTDAGGNTYAGSLMVPDAATFAKSVLRLVGCGRPWISGYWAHAVAALVVDLIPKWVLRWGILIVSKKMRASAVKKQ